MSYDTEFFRGFDAKGRLVTIPGNSGSMSEGQTYNSRMQAVMEAIGATAFGKTPPNFEGLEVAPDRAYKSGFHDVISDISGYANGAVRAVTGSIAEQAGVLQLIPTRCYQKQRNIRQDIQWC
jgi:hypothetical protein